MTAPRKPRHHDEKADEDISHANGRDHPAESEHDHKRYRLRGESAKRTDVKPEGWVPVKDEPPA